MQPKCHNRLHIVTGLFNAWIESSKLTENLLNSESKEGKEAADKWTEQWQEHKLTELNFVSLTSALIATTISASFAWRIVEDGPSLTMACWYSALFLAVISITSALQQANNLRKLTTGKNGFKRLRLLLGKEKRSGSENGTIEYRESRLQHFVWQTPIMLLNISILIYIIGFIYLIFQAAAKRAGGAGAKESRIAIVFAIAVAYGIGSYLVAMIGLYRELPKSKYYLQQELSSEDKHQNEIVSLDLIVEAIKRMVIEASKAKDQGKNEDKKDINEIISIEQITEAFKRILNEN